MMLESTYWDGLYQKVDKNFPWGSPKADDAGVGSLKLS